MSENAKIVGNIELPKDKPKVEPKELKVRMGELVDFSKIRVKK